MIDYDVAFICASGLQSHLGQGLENECERVRERNIHTHKDRDGMGVGGIKEKNRTQHDE